MKLSTNINYLENSILMENLDISANNIIEAFDRLKDIVRKTPLDYSSRLSEKYQSKIYIKREDLQTVRSYKIRGAYNLISSLSDQERSNGIVCASAGNHAQGVAYSCNKLKIKGWIFMPEATPKQKINKVKIFGGDNVNLKLVGKTFDEANNEAKKFCKENQMEFVHPFDDLRTIAGQGTVGKEIIDELKDIDIIISPIGGGGLISGVSLYAKAINPLIKIFGVDPSGAPKMFEAINNNKPVLLNNISTFVDGAAVSQIGSITYKIISKLLDKILLAPEGKVCTTMIELYQNEGIIAEPAGALSLSILDQIKEEIKGKTVVCILSGGNNDITRYPEIMERSLIYEGLKHYFLIEFAQKPGELRKFLDKSLGPDDDIVRFEYIKKVNKESGPALVGIELSNKNDLTPLLQRMKENEINYKIISDDDLLWKYLV